MQSIRRTDGHHFMTGFTVHTRASTSRTHDPEFSTEDFDDTTNKLICELHLEAAEVCEKMSKIHTYIACLKTRVSPRDFLTITSSVGLPLTTITTVDPAKQSKLDSNVDACCISVTTCRIQIFCLVTKPQSILLPWSGTGCKIIC